eukprot:7391685-Prymnesium_polylepis.2
MAAYCGTCTYLPVQCNAVAHAHTHYTVAHTHGVHYGRARMALTVAPVRRQVGLPPEPTASRKVKDT